jgi:acetylornithine deacetylase/succinyl-diaminopimelate desuccinylase-like protein
MVWGRGAVDMKDFDAMLLSTVRARARAGAVPARPLVLCFTADEEAGGSKGAGPLVDRRPDLLEGCREAVGEVGGFSTTVRGRRLYLIEAAEKGMAWMRMTARGNAGHGSMVHPDNAVTSLAAAVARIGQHEWPVRLTPTMEVLLAAVAELAGTEAGPDNAEELIEEFGSAARMLGAVIRNTVNPTMLEAGYKVNVVPGEATAHLDGRFLPGYEDEFLATLAELAGPDVQIEHLTKMDGLETPYDGQLAEAMTGSILEEDPDAVVAPYLMSGGTDAKHWERLGIRSFGFTPAAAAGRPRLHGPLPRRRRAGAGGRAGVRGARLRPVPRQGLANLVEDHLTLPDDLPAQHHPAGAVVPDPHPVELPAALLGALDEEPGDGRAGVLA